MREGIVMKKMLSSLIAVVMAASGAVPAMAKDTAKMQQILEEVKARIPDTDEYESFSSETREEDGDIRYSFNWRTDKDGKYKDMSLTVTDDGVISSYYYYDNELYRYDGEPNVNRLSQEEALMKAKELVKALNPDIYSSLVIEKSGERISLYDSTYGFSVKRCENGIPVYQDTGYLTVNSNADRLIGFNLNYTEGLAFGDASGAKDTKGAWEAFSANMGMELEYRTEYKDDKETAYLVYVPKMNEDQYIDAYTGECGEIVEVYPYDRFYAGGSVAMNEAAADMGAEQRKELSPRELEEMEKVSGLLSEAEAEELVRGMAALDFDKAMTLEAISCYKGWRSDDDYYYRLRFSSNTDTGYNYGYAEINAKTGELISWTGRNGIAEEPDKELEREELVKTCTELLPQLAPKHFGEGSAKDYLINEDNENASNVHYTRYVNGIKFGNDTVSIGINPESGKVNYYYIYYTDIEFPSAQNVITADEAAKSLSEQAEMTLYYIPTVSDVNSKKLKVDTVKLGYIIDNLYNCRIDANTGKIRDNEYTEETIPEYTDISGHYAENAIKTLAKYGIGFESGEFKPDAVITQQEYAALLVSTFVNHSPIILKSGDELNRYYTIALGNDIIKEGDGEPAAALTREKAAVYMIRAMGAEKYAQLTDIFKPMFPDVTENVGYIGILAGMKVFKGDENGNFNPEKQLTRAEAVMTIYNYLTK